jgi:penicillin-binding protein activator
MRRFHRRRPSPNPGNLARPAVSHSLSGIYLTMHHTSRFALPGLMAAAALLAGCVTSQGVNNPAGVPVAEVRPDERGLVAGTGIESQDLVAVTDKMSRSILGIPDIAQARAKPFIVLEPVTNNTRFPINKDIFLTRIRTQLNSKAYGRVSFLDRDMMKTLANERDLKRTGQVTTSSDPNIVEFRGADYFLTGKLDGMTTRTSAGTSDYVLYSFRLTNARTSEIVWEDSAEIKKQGLEDAAYR